MKEVHEERIPVMDNHKPLESLAEKTKDLPQEEQPLITVSWNSAIFRGCRHRPTPGTVTTTIDSSAQTDDTANFIVSKDTLVAYTILVIQTDCRLPFRANEYRVPNVHTTQQHKTCRHERNN